MNFPMLIKDILFPKHCFYCYSYGSYICDSCKKLCEITSRDFCPYCHKWSSLGSTHAFCKKPYYLDGSMSLFKYKSIIKSVIKNVKYHFVREAISEVFSSVPNSLNRFSRIVGIHKKAVLLPVPLHVLRRRRRGFNQAMEIAQILSLKLKLSTADNIVIRNKNTVSQTTCKNITERNKNIKHVFSLHKNTVTIPREIIIIDDVWTTGSTIKEIALVLKKAGAVWVYGLTIAR